MTVTLPTASATVATTSDFTTNLSLIRSKIGDTGGLTGAGRVYLTDERIEQIYTDNPSILGASIACVKAILADIARDTDFSAGAISTSRSQAFNQFKDLLEILQSEQGHSATAFVGGSSYAYARTIASRTDVPPRAFSIGMDRNR